VKLKVRSVRDQLGCVANKFATKCLVGLLVSITLNMPVIAATAVITNERSGDLVFMDESGKSIDVVKLCARPRGMVQQTSDNTLYIACSDDAQVVQFDLKTKQRGRTFSDLPGAMSLAIHELSKRLIVTNEGSYDGRLIFIASENAGLVHVFDGVTYEPVKTILTNLRPRRLALRDTELWVSSEMGSRVEIFDTSSLEKIDEIVFAPRGFRSEQLTPVDILFDQSQATAFVALGSANHLVIVDANKREILKYILVGHRPWGLGLTPDGKRLFVLNGLSDDVTIIDVAKRRPVRTSRTGLVPHSVEILN